MSMTVRKPFCNTPAVKIKVLIHGIRKNSESTVNRIASINLSPLFFMFGFKPSPHGLKCNYVQHIFVLRRDAVPVACYEAEAQYVHESTETTLVHVIAKEFIRTGRYAKHEENVID